jgi:hypothetical protein
MAALAGTAFAGLGNDRDAISREELDDHNGLQAARDLPDLHRQYGDFIRALHASRATYGSAGAEPSD